MKYFPGDNGSLFLAKVENNWSYSSYTMLLKLRTESTNYICFLLIFLAFARVHLIVIWMSWSTTFRFGLKLCCPTWEYSYLCGPQLTAVGISTFAFCTRMFLANTKLVQFNEPFVIVFCVVNLWLIIAVTHNLSSCEIKAWKKFRPEWDSNPWPLRYRCSALQTELSSHWELVTLWARNESFKVNR